MTENRIFKRHKIDYLNFISIGICLCFSIYFLLIEPVVFGTRKPIVFYSFGLYFLTLFFNYKALRNLNVWFIWIGLSVIQIGIYYKHGLDNTDWPAIRGLRNFWIYLIAFQILRWLSIKLQKKEFVTLAKMRTDLYDDRKFTFWDGVLFLPAIALIFILQII
jgi:hypothetical protein